ncbi:sensor histidine kinase [Microbacterium immunditiarum]|uniref:histidine kinase n=1 Tax=Microbacterium immunditiarum TaxID=337480 RepID=A0A7Y9GQ56_9MICO|nr:sensor histidine kinase [Microbacterium immunditiarum]NYE20487.1 signal transduction histidine kinase [Microbacterium immunditiarum]
MIWRRRLWVGVQDAFLAVVVIVLGLAELWIPFESVYGDGSPIVSSIGVVLSGAAIALRRLRTEACIIVFVVWLAIGVVTLGHMHALFFGQIVPFMVALYSLARHGRGRVPWIGAGVAAATLLFGDIFLDTLQGLDEIVFHWSMCTVAFAVGWGLRLSEQRAVAAALRLSDVEHHAREETIAAVAAERTRIARELHDILAHSVSVMVVQAGAAEQVVGDDPEFVRRALESIRSTGTASLDEVRRVVEMLRDPEDAVMLDPQPGLAALRDLVEASESHGLHTTLDTHGDLGSVPAGLGLAVYRIVQESLTNVRKHSDASHARVVVRVSEAAVELDVHDDGTAVGSGHEGRVGHGLIGIRERAALYGGEVTAGHNGSGFRVSAVLPAVSRHG